MSACYLLAVVLLAPTGDATVIDRKSHQLRLKLEAAVGSNSGLTLKVAGPLQLSGKFAEIGKNAKAAFEMWHWWSGNGAVVKQYDNYKYAMELELIDDNSDIEKAASIASKLADDPTVNVIVAPYTTAASLAVVKAVEGKKPVLVWGGASASIFETGNANVFGFMNLAGEYMEAGLKALYAKGARTVVAIKNEKPFSEAVCSGATKYAKNLGMKLLKEITVKNDGSDVADAMAELKVTETDVVVICGHAPDVLALTKQMTDATKYPDFRTNMILSTQVADPNYRSALQGASDCMMSPSQWVLPAGQKQSKVYKWPPGQSDGHPSDGLYELFWDGNNHGNKSDGPRDSVVGWTGRAFSAAFKAKTGSAPTYHAASAAAAGIALANAIDAAGGIQDMTAVAGKMAALKIETFYGPVAFKSSGAAADKQMFTVQNWPGKDTSPKVVTPEENREEDVIYPMSECIHLPRGEEWPAKSSATRCGVRSATAALMTVAVALLI